MIAFQLFVVIFHLFVNILKFVPFLDDAIRSWERKLMKKAKEEEEEEEEEAGLVTTGQREYVDIAMNISIHEEIIFQICSLALFTNLLARCSFSIHVHNLYCWLGGG